MGKLSDSRTSAVTAGKVRLGRAVALSLGAMIALLGVLLTLLATHQIVTTASAVQQERAAAQLELLEHQLDGSLALARHQLADLAADPRTRALLANDGGPDRVPRQFRLFGHAQPLLLLDGNGWVREPDGKQPRLRFLDQGWFKSVAEGTAPGEGLLLFETDARPILRLAAPIGTGTRFAGAIVADLELARLLGTAIDPALVGSMPLEIRAGPRPLLAFGPQEELQPDEQPFWRPGLTIRRADSAPRAGAGGVALALEFVLLALLATLLCVTVLIWLAQRHVVRPLASLRSRVHAIVAGRNPDEELLPSPLREIHELQTSVQRMARILADRESSLRADQQTLSARVEERTAQLRAMNSQLVATIQQKTTAQQELVEAKDAAVAANHAKTMFLANMSHEIRTPMNAILGFCDILCEENPGEPALVEPIETIRRNAQALVRLLNDILDVAKIETGRFELERIPFDPHELVRDVCDLHGLRAREKEIGLRCELAEDLPRRVVTDPTRLRQVLTNLIGNAIKFTETGTIGVRVDWQPDGDAGSILFVIADTGIGLTRDQIARLFQPFTQADSSFARRYGGTGLGLSISRGLVELLGGSLQLESEPARGTICRFDIAVGLPAEQSVEESPVPVSGDVPAGLQVLLAEDGRDNQRLLTHYLRQLGAEVTLVAHGGEAIDAVRTRMAQGCPFDLILMDIQMPEVDGHEATQRIRAAGYTGPILALTAHAMSGHREQCLASGCDEFLTKPVVRSALVTTIAELVRRPAPAT